LTLKTIAVDLTPVLPGGENGGAKLFAMELVRCLAALAPATRFVLLTQALSHDELAELDRANVERVCVIGRAAGALRPALLAGASRVLAFTPRGLRRAAARMGYRLHAHAKRRAAAPALRRIAPDLLFCPFTAPANREAGVPCVCTIYDLQYRAHPEYFTVEDATQRELAFRDACRHATLLAAISEFSRRSAIAEGGLEGDRIRTIRLRLPSPPPSADERRHRTLQRFGLDAGRFVLYPANFWKHKNHEALLAGFAAACSSGLPGDVKLVLTGAPGARESELRETSRRTRVADRIVFAGYLPRDDLLALMSVARGVILPSLYEGFGLPVVEAMALGVPVACSDTTALPEVADDAALLFDPRTPEAIAGALRGLVEDEALRARLVEAGRRRSLEFRDPDRMAREYLELFQDAAARERSASGRRP
jgi:glycosyltransferase involved in cell wall biosynthesis